ncbi:hypothetical protein L6R49_10270 [Myxococcota bacterium]|nr:hypothetical protein [Myxococcota bacterium]
MTSTEPGLGAPSAEDRVRRARRALALASVWWVLLLVVSVSLDAPVEGGPDPWLSRFTLLGMAAFAAAGALTLRPGSLAGWATATAASGATVFGCVTIPLAAVALMNLLHPEVMAACLGGVWARRLAARRSGADPRDS